MTRSTVPSSCHRAPAKSASCSITRPAVCGAYSAERTMLRFAHPRASGSASTACTWARGTSCAIARAIAPEPVPRSATTGSATSISASLPMAQPVITSVSGRGTKTPGPTSSSVYRKWVSPVMCWSGSRASRRATSSQNLGSKPESGTRCSSPRRTPCTCAAITSASARGDSTPASASRAAAIATSSSSRVIACRQAGPVGLDEGADHRVQVAVEHLVQVVGLVTDPVVGDAVLREVVGADPLGPVHGPDLAAPFGLRLGLRVGLRLGEQPRAQDAQRLLLVLQLAFLVLAGHDDPGGQMGDPHGRVGGVHALAAGPGRPENVHAQVPGL